MLRCTLWPLQHTHTLIFTVILTFSYPHTRTFSHTSLHTLTTYTLPHSPVLMVPHTRMRTHTHTPINQTVPNGKSHWSLSSASTLPSDPLHPFLLSAALRHLQVHTALPTSSWRCPDAAPRLTQVAFTPAFGMRWSACGPL